MTVLRLDSALRAENKDNVDEDGFQKKQWFELILDPYPTKIPKELRDEIYRAEENTPAAKNRQVRVIVFGIVGFLSVAVAFGNISINEIIQRARDIDPNQEVSYSDIGLAWLEQNFVLQLLLTSKAGGYLGLLGGAALGFLAEAEVRPTFPNMLKQCFPHFAFVIVFASSAYQFDNRRDNAEKIFEEMDRRRVEREALEKIEQKKGRKRRPTQPLQSRSKASPKKMKRFSELAELSSDVVDTEATVVEEEVEVAPEPVKKDEGFLGKFKEIYAEADKMAASGALLLNKELEDRGIIEKITDDSGLKVIGKEAAAESEKKKKQSDAEKE